MSADDQAHDQAHDHGLDPTPAAAALHEIVEGVFAWIQPDGSWWINNAGAIAPTGGGHHEPGLVVVDTCATEERTRRFLAAVASATDDAPIRVAANTHEHGDHTYGNCLLPAATTLIGHENMRARLLVDPIIDGCPPIWEPVPDWGSVRRRVPNLVTRSDLTVFAGDRRIDLVHPGHTAHTTGDLVAWLPDERVLFTGDLVFHGLTPLVFAGSVEGALRSLDWMASFDPAWIVPGHGPLVDAASVAATLADHERYYRFILDLAASAARDGLDPLTAANQVDLGEFAAWADAERLVLNLHRAMADAAGRELDLLQTFTDAVAWNGGPLTTHVCCLS